MKARWIVGLVTCCFPLVALAQSRDTGPIATPSGPVQFQTSGREVIVTLQNATVDHLPAKRIVHFDDLADSGDTVRRMLLETDAGPVLYDFRQRPTRVQAIGQRMTVQRVFWQGEEVVMQGSKGWFRFEHGVLTKLHYSKTTFH